MTTSSGRYVGIDVAVLGERRGGQVDNTREGIAARFVRRTFLFCYYLSLILCPCFFESPLKIH